MTLEETYASLNEGINDPGIFKAVFMAGGPGSGKSLIAKKLGFQSMGLRPVNSDSSFEAGLKKAGLSLKMPEDEEEQRDAIRVHAKAMTAKRQDMLVKGRMGLVIDSTARDVKKLLQQKLLLEKLGYETAMVFVNTSLETALDRNRTRERSIPDKIVKDNHAQVRQVMGKFQNAFGRANFFIVDNDGDLKDAEKNTTKIFPRLRAFVKSFPDNKMAKAWKTALTMKPMKNVALAAEYEHPIDMERRLEEDRVTDALVDKQKREREQLKDKHDREKDRDRLRITRLKNVSSNQDEAVNPAQQAAIAIAKKKSGKYDKDGNKKEVSDAVLATKEKIYKDLKKKRDYFEKEYGKDKADEVMHGTAMNMAKKQHKVAEGRFESELTRQLQLEVLNMQQRRAIGMRMKRLAKKIARTKARKKKRMKDPRALKTKANKQARSILFKKMSGGKAAGDLSVGARIAIGKKLDKKKGAIAKLAKRLLPKVKKQEVERLARFRQQQNQKDKQ
jgi:predicted kinase